MENNIVNRIYTRIRTYMLFVIGLLLFGMFFMQEIGSHPNRMAVKAEELDILNNFVKLDSRVLIEEKGFGSSTINVSKFRTNAVVTTEWGQVVSYFDHKGDAYLALLDNENVYKVKIIAEMEERLLGDGHCSISLGYWNDTIWFAYGCHANIGFCGKVKLDDLLEVNTIKADKLETEITYPAFYNVKADKEKFLFVYRNDKDENWYYIDLAQTGNFELSQEQMICEGKYNLYINDIGVSDNGKYVAIPFVERYPVLEDFRIRNDGIYLMWSEDCMQSWNSLSMKGMSLPVTIQDTEKIISLGLEDNLMNQESTYVTDRGEVWFTRITNDTHGIPQIYLSGYDIKSHNVVSYQVTESKNEFELMGKGTLRNPISRSQVIASDNYLHVIYRIGDEICISSAEKIDGMRIGKMETLKIANNVGQWEPNFDPLLWEEERRICLYVQESYQEDGDILGTTEKVTPIYLYYLQEIV